MIECPICDYHYSEKRTHCPTCGVGPNSKISWVHGQECGILYPIVIAKGAERARQLPQSPRFFSLCDPDQ